MSRDGLVLVRWTMTRLNTLTADWRVVSRVQPDNTSGTSTEGGGTQDVLLHKTSQVAVRLPHLAARQQRHLEGWNRRRSSPIGFGRFASNGPQGLCHDLTTTSCRPIHRPATATDGQETRDENGSDTNGYH
jgi:hypothetical protein